jgi:hypothetical protein
LSKPSVSVFLCFLMDKKSWVFSFFRACERSLHKRRGKWFQGTFEIRRNGNSLNLLSFFPSFASFHTTHKLKTMTTSTVTRKFEELWNKRPLTEIEIKREKEENTFVGLYGRFIRGINGKELSKLSDGPDKLLSWVCGEDLLLSLLTTKNDAEAMYKIGFDLDWMEKKLEYGTIHRLILFSPPSSSCSSSCLPNEGAVHGTAWKVKLATWDNIFELVSEFYGNEVHRILSPHFTQIQEIHLSIIDPHGRLTFINNLSAEEASSHPEFLTKRRLLAASQRTRDDGDGDGEVTLYQARGFLIHSVGCNLLFRGDGMNKDGNKEFLTSNRTISEIEGAVLIGLHYTKEDVGVLR